MQLRTAMIFLVCINQHISKVASSKLKKKPNVLFILTDDQGYRDVGYHGSLFPTPVIDRLAAEGVKLENYYVQPICSPTRSQLMSGRYQIHTGLQHGNLNRYAPSCLPTDEVTLAQKMQEAGYTTHMSGKWHLGLYEEACLPNNRGFDTFLGILNGGTGDHYIQYPTYDFYRNLDVAFEYNGTYNTHAFTDEAIDVIRNADDDTPFFLYLAYTVPHTPLQVPEEYKDPLRGIFNNENRLTLAAMITCMDEGIGRVVDALKAKGVYDNTVIIYSSDNGGHRRFGSNWPLRGRKGTIYEGGVRTIGFVHSSLLSNKVKGTVNNELIHVSDWLPTIVEGIAGWNTDGTKPLDGFNQWKTIKYGTCSPRVELLHNIDPLNLTPGGRDWVVEISPFNVSISAAIRYQDWKLITGDDGNVRWRAPPDTELEAFPAPDVTEQLVWLFNIKDDPREMNDLSEERRGVVRFLLAKLQEYLLDSVPVYSPPTRRDRADPCLNGNNCVWGPWT